jgi:demethylmenaquinone methyltransferase/2-methoxy-6-polyprenyl-1,4-benzoquinol methylase
MKQSTKNQDNTKADIKPLQKMFNQVPERYDLMNRLLTLRMDELWRKEAVRLCLGKNPETIMDICTGTGDLALRIAKAVNSGKKIIALDFSQPMLDQAKKKSSKKNISNIDFILGDVGDLPYPDNTMDAIGIGFAFRNLTYKNPKTDLYLKEIYRVIKPGGRFVIAETSQPKSKFIRSLYHTYMKQVVGTLGGILSGHKAAYRYLASSAINYYDSGEVQDLLLKTGFSKVDVRLKMMGAAAIYIAEK